MHAGLGCLFILIFGFIFFAIAIVRTLLAPFFSIFRGGRSGNGAFGQGTRNAGAGRGAFGDPFGGFSGGNSQNGTYNNPGSDGTNNTKAGNAHHSNGNSRQRRKIFTREEGEYVDFEDV